MSTLIEAEAVDQKKASGKIAMAQQKVPLTIVVLNNGDYGAMLSFSKRMKAPEPPGVRLPGISFEGLAGSLGVPHTSVAAPDQIYPVLTNMLAADGPNLVDIKIDPEGGESTESRSCASLSSLL